MPKSLTREQLQGRKDKAVRFVEDVLGDPERAAEIEDESLEDYAERRKIQIVDNPRIGACMAPSTKEELKERIRELEEENDELQDALDEIADIVAPPEEEEEEGDGEEGEGEE